jgi:uncharacterized membrane protein YadS
MSREPNVGSGVEPTRETAVALPSERADAGDRARNVPGLIVAGAGAAVAWGLHWMVPAVPALTAVMLLGVVAAHLPVIRDGVRGVARPGLSVAGKRLMRLAVVLLGASLSLQELRQVGLPTMVMVVVVVVITFIGTWWLGGRIGLHGDQPLLIAVGYAEVTRMTPRPRSLW